MFEDSLFASNSASNPRRRWTALVSFFVQTLFIGTLVALPLLFTEALPLTRLPDYLTVPTAEPPAVEQVVRRATRPPESNMTGNVVLQPRSIPNHVEQVVNIEPPPQIGSAEGYVPGSTNTTGESSRFMASLFNNVRPPAPATLGRPTRPIPVSTGVSQGLLLRQVKPVYPPIALAAHIQGEVVLQAVIGKDGTIQNLHVISGHPMLIKAAAEAVQQWRYRPYMLNGEPVAVETQVRVTFTIS
jgi:periplasmic protein TonB